MEEHNPMTHQLLLFEEPREEKLIRELQALKEQCERIRKAQFAKINAVNKVAEDVKHELEILKKAMCLSC